MPLVLGIYTDSGGSAGVQACSNSTVSGVTTSQAMRNATFTNCFLNGSVTYWLIASAPPGTDDTNYYRWYQLSDGTVYAKGIGTSGLNFPPGTATGSDFTFEVYATPYLNLKVRSCDDSACSGETFVGPLNTTDSNFTSSPALLNTSITPNNRYSSYICKREHNRQA